MGGISSKTTSEVLTDIAVNASMNSMLECQTSATQEQLIQLEQVTGDVILENISMKQGSSVDVKCLMSATKKAEIANTVANAIAQHAESQGQAVLSALGSNKAEAAAKLSNEFQSKIDANTEQQINTNISQTQGIHAGTVGGKVVIRGVTMEQSAKVTAQATMNSAAFSTTINDAANKMDQSSKAEDRTIFTDMANAIKNFLLSAVGLITAGAVFLVIVFVLLF